MTLSDQTGYHVTLSEIPKRIISLVPSITELLFDLGLSNCIIGRTKFCIHPMPQIKSIKPFGGTKTLHIDRILDAQPDLILANKEENNREDIIKLRQHCPVYTSDINTINDLLQFIDNLGHMTYSMIFAKAIIQQVKESQQNYSPNTSSKSVLYLIWRQPYMSVGKDTFIHHMIRQMGMQSVTECYTRYPSLEVSDIIALNPNYIFLSSEPYPFADKHIEELQTFLPNTKIVLVDGEMFSWYGSRILKSFDYFHHLNHQLIE